MFSKIAPRYDFMNRLLSLGRDISWRHLAIKQANFKQGSRILDLGIGTGDMAREVIRQNISNTVFGVDNCRELMEYGRQKPQLKRSIHWIIGEAKHLSFSHNSFDGIVAAFSIRNISDLISVFSEIYRVVKPDGKLVVLDMVKPNNCFFYKIFKFYFKHIVPKLGQWLGSDPHAYAYLFPSIEYFYTSEELKNILQNMGFREILHKDLMFKTVTICIGTK